ncbi:LysR family transcriptional regulator [Paenibacillus sp. IHBB 10380]|uniref:LysR family transcriptional regulator n=1 Tax=Paenibacillus sp. IHBB 10380 TaxID=1566358 RepID=UPI0009E2EE1E|nr:LysR family transcriptional regulator [Paenibacillus sp. IHBB 10380]
MTFKTILETGSYTNAAFKLGYTQSTITSHIQTLEQEIGEALFTYVQKKLTSIGKELLPSVNDLLGTYNQISTLKNKKNISGELRIAAPKTYALQKY